MPALCSGLERSESPEHSASPSLHLAQQAATDGPELAPTSGPRLLAKLTLTKKQIKAVEKTSRGKVTKQTFPLDLQVLHATRDSHFPTAPTTTNL